MEGSCERIKKIALVALKTKYQSLILRHRSQLIEESENIFEVVKWMGEWFEEDWGLNLVRSEAQLDVTYHWYQKDSSIKELEEELNQLKQASNTSQIFVIMSKYEKWDFTFNALLERAKLDLETYIDDFESDGEEYAVESPIWRIELTICTNSKQIIEYMQEFGWSTCCIWNEAQYLHHQSCSFCEEQIRLLNEKEEEYEFGEVEVWESNDPKYHEAMKRAAEREYQETWGKFSDLI